MTAAERHAASRLSLPRYLSHNGPRRQGFAPPRKPRAPLTARAVAKLILRQGKGGECKAHTLDHVNRFAASLQVPAKLVSTAYSDRRNARFTSPESAIRPFSLAV